MDVSRIGPISPQQIDWRKLTAKEIIKYDNEGVEVPTQYLQWAKEFQQDLAATDKDDTTYEMATAATANANTSANQDTANTTNDDDQNTDDNQKLTASQRRDIMRKSGMSYVKIAKIFGKESAVRAQLSEASEAALNEIGNTSDSETESLESSIENILSQAEELKSQISALKHKKSGTAGLGNMAKIQELKSQLKALGMTGQAMAVGISNDLNDNNNYILAQEDLNAETIDYGAVTIKSAAKIMSNIFLFAYGLHIVRKGERAINKGESAIDTANTVQQQNNDNITRIESAKNKISITTGVDESAAQDSESSKNSNKQDSGNSNDPANQSAGITETEKSATANLEQILQAKIRRGEDINSA